MPPWPRPWIRRALLLLFALPILCAVGQRSTRAEDAAPTIDALIRQLDHVMEAPRRSAEQALARRFDEQAVRLLTLIDDAAPRRRASGWRLLMAHPLRVDTARAYRALADPSAEVGVAAARALVAALAHQPVERIRVRREALPPIAVPRVARAIRDALEGARDALLPRTLLLLGEPLVPALGWLLEQPGLDELTTDMALDLLGRVGSAAAQATLVRTLPQAGASEQVRRWMRAWTAHPLGDSLDAAWERLRGRDATTGALVSWEVLLRRVRGGAWRHELLRLIAFRPPAHDREELNDALWEYWNRVRRSPRLYAAFVEACLAIGEPSRSELAQWIGCLASVRMRIRAQREESGRVLPLLHARLDSPDLVEGVTALLEDTSVGVPEAQLWHTRLPHSVEAWGAWLVEAHEPAQLERMARALIEGQHDQPVRIARQLGCRLLVRLGRPIPELVQRLLADDDALIRREALALAEGLPDEARLAALQGALEDPDATVRLVAAARLPADRVLSLERRREFTEAYVLGAGRERDQARAALLGRCFAVLPAASAPISHRHAAIRNSTPR